MLKIPKVKTVGLLSSIIVTLSSIVSCDSGGGGSSNNGNSSNGDTSGEDQIEQPTDSSQPTGAPNGNAIESYSVRVTFVSGGGVGYAVGDTVLVQRTADSIIVGDQSYSPYEEFLDSVAVSQYTFDVDNGLGVVAFIRSENTVQVNIGLGQFQGRY